MRGQWKDVEALMALPLLFAFQAATAPAAVPAEIVVTPVHFDLADVRRLDLSRGTAPDCDRSDPESIIVCGRRPAVPGYQLEQWERIFAVEPVRAEMRLPGNATGSVNIEQVELLRGEVSNRIMFRIRTPF
jgi:hypothetical protein